MLFFLQLLLLATQAFCQDETNTTTAAVSTFESQFSASILLLPGSDAYEAEIDHYWNVANQEIKPALVVKPTTAAEAAAAIKILAEYNVPFGMRSGGHMPNVGSNTSPGVVIVTTGLNAAITYPSAGVARLTPGKTWAEVYEELLEIDAVAVGGRYNAVGVGGYLIGGGVSHLNNEYGWAADRIVNMQVILASGKIVNANATSNSDLFWALKGGTSNFGLVTYFDVKYVSQANGAVWGGTNTISSANVNETIYALDTWQRDYQPNDHKAGLELSLMRGQSLGSTTSTLATLTLYYGAPVEFPEVFSVLTDVPSVSSTLRNTTMLAMANELATGGGNTKRQQFYTITWKADPAMALAAHDEFFEGLSETKFYDDADAFAVYTLQPVSKSWLEVGFGSSPLSLDPAGGPYTTVSVSFQYSDPDLDSVVLEYATSNFAAVKQISVNKGVEEDFLYLNDAGQNQDPLAAYGSANYAKLQSIRDKYDPKKVFTNLCSGVYKLD